MRDRFVGDQSVDVPLSENRLDNRSLVQAAGNQQAVRDSPQVGRRHGDDGVVQLVVDRVPRSVQEGAEDFADGADLLQLRQALADAVDRRQLGTRRQVAAGNDRHVGLARPLHDLVDPAVREEEFAAFDAGAIYRRSDVVAVGAERLGQFGGDLEGICLRATRQSAHQ
ncbi:hypothetical protein SDC9_182353 [bioreactor metagenome]|uniref:Uncharacterized protein n=1 Tax=bioreactor metagenome TaxID=1076179 RepID=A0A645H9S0_9ZZZZ